MKRFVFFIVILLVIIVVLSVGLIKNLLKGDSSEVYDDGFVISESKNQKLSISYKNDDVFILKGHISDGTHSKIVARVADNVETTSSLEFLCDITDEPFELEIDMPDNKSEAYLNLYFRDNGVDTAICVNGIRAVYDGGWEIVENINTENNNEILDKLKEKDYLYADSELGSVPQGILTLSDTITKAHDNDYDKSYAIYLWLCEHIFTTDTVSDKSLEYVFNTRIADNESYCNYFAALLRAQNIPCAIVECDKGYFFNRVYIDGKWYNIQIDRDTFNRYTSHRYLYNRKNLYTHFGIPTDIISSNYIVKNVKK